MVAQGIQQYGSGRSTGKRTDAGRGDYGTLATDCGAVGSAEDTVSVFWTERPWRARAIADDSAAFCRGDVNAEAVLPVRSY